MKRAEVTFIALVLVIFGAGVLIDVAAPSRGGDRARVDAGPFVSSGWYCPAPSGEGVNSTMATANLDSSAVRLRRSAVGGTTQSGLDELNLEARSTHNKLVSDFGLGDSAGLVEAFGGNNSTHLMVMAQGRGASAARCSAQPSSRWLFASGSTSRGENHYLLISNPFREEAVVTIRLMAGDREVEPARLKDLVIRTLSQTTIYLSDYLTDVPNFGIEVTASRGRVVTSRYSYVTSGGGDGVSLGVGAQETSARWLFADGRVPADGEDSIAIVNPGDREALIGVVFMTDGERTAPPGLSEIPVPAGRQVVFNVSDHLPRGTGYGVELSSINDVQVVAERRTAGVFEGQRSYESTLGVAAPAQTWTLPVGSPAGGSTTLAMVNVGQSATQVSVTLLGPVGESQPGELASVPVEPGRKVVLDLTPHLGGGLLTAVVEAEHPVLAVESRTLLGSPYNDFSATAGQAVR